MEKEIWRDIPGYEGHYQVSDLGRVRGVTRSFVNKNGHSGHVRGRIMKPGPHGKYRNYLQVQLSVLDKKKSFTIHRLVMLAFVGPSSLEVDHKDRDSANNKLSNLRYCTTRFNCSHHQCGKKKHSKYIGVSFSKAPRAKNRWIAYIRIKKQRIILGSFPTEELAHEAYQKSLLELNEPPPIDAPSTDTL